jgi:signal transduction histidine kinase
MEDSRASILVVDDEPENVRFLGRLLSAQGYEVFVAESGERALEILDAVALQARVGLILLDILMPGGLNGLETCRRLKAREALRSIPVIFLTAKDENETMLQAFRAGGADYVPKPFNTEVLLARVRAHLQLARLSQELEVRLWERTRELREANSELQRMAKEMCLVEEREKKRLASELHDSPMQKLAIAQLQIAAAARRQGPESDQGFEVGLELLRDALQELRTLQFELSPRVLYEEGLSAALRWLVDQTARRFGLALTFVESGEPQGLAQELALVLFQCVRELAHNVVKHAQATRGHVELSHEPDALRLVVSDNGKGFAGDALRAPAADGGYGLYSMRERLGLWGGDLSIESGGSGTRVTLRAPVGPQAIGVSSDVRRGPAAAAPPLGGATP